MSYLGTKPANTVVTSQQIADGVVSTADLADNALTTSKIADGAITTAKIAEGAVVTADLANNAVTTVKLADAAITAPKIAAGAISSTTFSSTNTIVKFSNGNATLGQPVFNTFTLTEAEAPIGSYVVISILMTSGSNAGDQYCSVYQRDNSFQRASIASFIEGWFWLTSTMALFYINDAADRTFHVVHGTIQATTINDFRQVRYHGFIRVTQ